VAQVYSLICWAGKDGETITITNASPAVATITAHGLAIGGAIVLSTTGALPTGLTAGTTYYAGNLAANTFNFYDTEANAITSGATGRVNTSSAGSGTHTATSAYWNGLTTAQKLRYGASGSERAFDGVSEAVTNREANASSVDTEVVEIGEAFVDLVTSGFDIDVTCDSFTIESKVDGIRSAAFHGGNVPADITATTVNNGYIFKVNYNAFTSAYLTLTSPDSTVDGLLFYISVGGGRYS
jgi:hypothetical protein